MWINIPIRGGYEGNKKPYDLAPGELQTASGVIMLESGYQTFGDRSLTSTMTISGTAIAAWHDQHNDRLFAGTTDHLYVASSSAYPYNGWDNISIGSGTSSYAASSWDFCHYGTNNVMCPGRNANTGPQLYTGSGDCVNFVSTMPTGVTIFKASHCLYKYGFVLFGDVIENTITYNTRVRWSNHVQSTNGITSLEETIAGGADYRDIFEAHGKIVDLEHLGDNIAVAHQYGFTVMYLMQQAPYGFAYSPFVVKGRSIAEKSLIPWEGGVFYIDANSGIRYFNGSSDVLVKSLPRDFLRYENTTERCFISHTFIDDYRRTIGWLIQRNYTAAVEDYLWMWDIDQRVLTYRSYGITVAGGITNTYPLRLLSKTGAKISTFQEVGSANIDTKELTGEDLGGTKQNIITIRNVRLLGSTYSTTDGPLSATVSLYYRMTPDATAESVTAVYNSADGTYNAIASGRFIYVRAALSGNSNLNGIEVDAVISGER